MIFMLHSIRKNERKFIIREETLKNSFVRRYNIFQSSKHNLKPANLTLDYLMIKKNNISTEILMAKMIEMTIQKEMTMMQMTMTAKIIQMMTAAGKKMM